MIKEDDLVKFENSFSKTSTKGCYPWIMGKDKDGYGLFYANGSAYKAHRLAFYLRHRCDMTGLCVCHICDNPECVNPDHLFLGTINDNNQDRHKKGRSKNKPTPGESHNLAKLSNEDVFYIRTSLDSLQKDLASRYKVSITTISNIQNGKTWKHLL